VALTCRLASRPSFARKIQHNLKNIDID
jgi:hypothetical protein